MDEFYKKLKTKLNKSIITIIIAAGIILISYVSFKANGINSHSSTFMRGFQFGLIVAAILLETQHIYSLRKALKSEAELRKLYIKETDERKKAIHNKIAYKGFWTTVGALLVAGIASGFYSITVFVTLMSVLLFMLVIAIIYKCIYYKIM